jgi:hypothetical protein
LNNNQTGYVSLIGTAFIDPIATLIERIMKLHPKGPNEVQASITENGYSASIIVLTVMLIESILNRTRYIVGKDGKGSALNFFKDTFAVPNLSQELEEVYVLRDSIAHNHVWESTVEWNKKELYFAGLPTRQIGYGDKKYTKVINEKVRKSKVLGLNLFPTRVCLHDVTKVLNVANKLFIYLENIDTRFCYISNESIEFNGEYLTFKELIGKVSYNT